MLRKIDWGSKYEIDYVTILKEDNKPKMKAWVVYLLSDPKKAYLAVVPSLNDAKREAMKLYLKNH